MRLTAFKSVLLLATVAFLGYVVGINNGFTQGYNAALNSRSADAAMIVGVLTRLPSENLTDAR